MRIETLQVHTDLPMQVKQVRVWFEQHMDQPFDGDVQARIDNALELTRKRIGEAAGVASGDTQDVADGKVEAWVEQRLAEQGGSEPTSHERGAVTEMLHDVRGLLRDQKMIVRVMGLSGVEPPLALVNQMDTLEEMYADLSALMNEPETSDRADKLTEVLVSFDKLTRQPRYDGRAIAELIAGGEPVATELMKVEHALHQRRKAATDDAERNDVRHALRVLAGHDSMEAWAAEEQRQREQAVRTNKVITDAVRSAVTVQ